jgi:hypothetical protein
VVKNKISHFLQKMENQELDILDQFGQCFKNEEEKNNTKLFIRDLQDTLTLFTLENKSAETLDREEVNKVTKKFMRIFRILQSDINLLYLFFDIVDASQYLVHCIVPKKIVFDVFHFYKDELMLLPVDNLPVEKQVEETDLFYTLLLFHPNAIQKIGSGIDCFFVKRFITDKGTDVCCVFIRRCDGTDEDISLFKCYRETSRKSDGKSHLDNGEIVNSSSSCTFANWKK